jgi:hypothetical protein
MGENEKKRAKVNQTPTKSDKVSISSCWSNKSCGGRHLWVMITMDVKSVIDQQDEQDLEVEKASQKCLWMLEGAILAGLIPKLIVLGRTRIPKIKYPK